MEFKDIAIVISEAVEFGLLPYINNFYENEDNPTIDELAEYLEKCEKPALICKLTNGVFEDLYYELDKDLSMWWMDSGVSLQVSLSDSEDSINIDYYYSTTEEPFITLQIESTQDKDIIIDAIDTTDTIIVDLINSIGFDKLEKLNLVINY